MTTVDSGARPDGVAPVVVPNIRHSPRRREPPRCSQRLSDPSDDLGPAATASSRFGMPQAVASAAE
jgi:hypothetical protein